MIYSCSVISILTRKIFVLSTHLNLALFCITKSKFFSNFWSLWNFFHGSTQLIFCIIWSSRRTIVLLSQNQNSDSFHKCTFYFHISAYLKLFALKFLTKSWLHPNNVAPNKLNITEVFLVVLHRNVIRQHHRISALYVKPSKS